MLFLDFLLFANDFVKVKSKTEIYYCIFCRQTMKADTGRTLILAANLLTKLETLQKQKRPSPLTPNIATSPSIKSSSSSTAPTADRTTTRETTYEAAIIRK